jgi:hypothetical protein
VLDVVTRVDQHLTLSIELKRVAWLVYFFCPLKVFGATLCELGLGGVDDLVQVVDLSEPTALLFEQIN